MNRVVLIANPVASQFTGGSHRRVMSILSKSHDEVEAIWPATPAATAEMAAEAAASGASLVVAMGGDGMVHHVSQGLVGSDSVLGVIPVGTTNVVARLLGIPKRVTRAARLIAGSRRHEVLGTTRLTLTRAAVETVHHALFACGFGMDALVVNRANEDPYRKYRFGSLHYARTALGVGLIGFPSTKPHVEVRSGPRHALAVGAQIQFREVYTYFGPVPLRIASDPPSPMTVLVMERLRRRRVPRIVYDLLAHRSLGEVPDLQVWEEVESLELRADPAVAAQADGEALGLVDSARVDWFPHSLRVIAGY